MLYIKLVYFLATSIILIELIEGVYQLYSSVITTTNMNIIDSSSQGKGAYKYVKYFEHLDYNAEFVKTQHNRVRRSIRNGQPASKGQVFLDFQSHGRYFVSCFLFLLCIACL